MCVLLVYTLLKVVDYCDLSVLSMSVMGFQKKSLGGGWVGGVSSIQFFLDFWIFFLTLQSPLSGSGACTWYLHFHDGQMRNQLLIIIIQSQKLFQP